MPPGRRDDGLRAAVELRTQRPEVGVLVLSQFYDESYAMDLIGDSAEGVGYLLKERVGDVKAFTQAVGRVAAGGSALDPEIVGRMLGRRPSDSPLDRLSPRERDVLAALAEGQSTVGSPRRSPCPTPRSRSTCGASSTSSVLRPRRTSIVACWRP